MPKSITMPAGNTQTSQRKNALATSATTAHTQAELQSQIDSLNSDVYDKLTLNREHLTMLWKMVNTAIDDLTNGNPPYYAIEQAKQSLFIAQHLTSDFLDGVNWEIEKHPCHEVDSKA